MIHMTGVPEFNRTLDALVKRMSVASRTAVVTGGHLLEAQTKAALTTFSHQAGTPTPSPPGSPPALITGTLRRSIKVTSPQAHGVLGWSVSVGPTAIYGRIQELGGNAGRNHATRLPPRPYLAPSLQAVIDNGTLAACYATAWRGALAF